MNSSQGSRPAGASPRSDGKVLAHLPGEITRVDIQAGDTVTVGQILAIIDSMKMANEVRSPMAGTIAAVHIKPAQLVSKGDLMIEISP